MTLLPSSTVLRSFAIFQISFYLFTTRFLAKTQLGFPSLYVQEEDREHSTIYTLVARQASHEESLGNEQKITTTHVSHEADGMTSHKTVPFTRRNHVR
jgi:hypothetical protein